MASWWQPRPATVNRRVAACARAAPLLQGWPMTDRILVERRGPLLVMGLNRADKLNAFDPPMIQELARAYTLLAKDRELRCGVVWAQGRYFTAGLDLPRFMKRLPLEPISPIIPRGCVDPWGVATAPCPKPVVTAVQGPCLTMGIELMLCGQVTVAAEGATFSQIEVARGLLPFGGGTVRWPQAVGAHNAFRYLLTGDTIDANEALRIGLVQQVVAGGKSLDAALEIAGKIAAQAPLAVQATLRNVRVAENRGARAALAKVRGELVRLLLTKDVRRGLAAFRDKRPADFRGD